MQILTKDSVTVSVDGVVYFRVSDPIASVANVSNADYSTRLLAQTTLRNVLGTKNLAEVLSDREGISHSMQVSSKSCKFLHLVFNNCNLFLFSSYCRRLQMKPQTRGVLRWSEQRLKTSNCPSSCREPWPLKQRQPVRPEQR